MATFAQSDEDIRRYLLGLLDDENARASIDDRLFADDEFADHLEVIEEELISDHISGKLSDEEAEAFRTRMTASHTLRTKVVLASSLRDIALERSVPDAKPSFFDSIFAFFKMPAVIGGFAVLLIAAVLLVVWLPRSQNTELADLRSIYRNERPTESRISDFEYAPLVVRRAAAEEREAAKLRRIELALLEKTEKSPNSPAFHDLGRFYLTQQRFADAIKALERSVSLAPGNAAAINDLGSTYFERAKDEAAADRFKSLTTALEKFAIAVELSPSDLASAFNYAKCLQALDLYAEARKAWHRYLELDNTSGWADEARKAIGKLEQSAVIKPKEQSVEDTFAAIAAGDSEQVWRIQSNTRDMMSGLWMPGQLVRRYVVARARGDDLEAKRSIGALKILGELERSRNVDFFVSELTSFYEAKTDRSRFEGADTLMREGYGLLDAKKPELAVQKFAESRDLFAASGDKWLSLMADLWSAHALSDLSKLDESDRILDRLRDECEKGRFVWLSLHVDDWAANNDQLRNNVGKSLTRTRSVAARAETIGDITLTDRSKVLLSSRYQYLGELSRALDLMAGISSEILYGEEGSKRWRRNNVASNALIKLGKPRLAEIFALESLTNALAGRLKYSQAVDDCFRNLIIASAQKGDLDSGLRYAEQARERALSTDDASMKTRLVRLAAISTASLKFKAGDYEAALSAYDEALSLESAQPGVRIGLFELYKGKTMTLISLGLSPDEQLATTLALSEEIRSQNLDANSRAAFIASERDLAEALISHSLDKADSVRAFELAESARARSLLDFVGGSASLDQIESRFPTVSETMGIDEIRRSLPKNVQIVQYALLEDKIAIWHLTSDKIEYISSPIKESLIESDVERLLDTAIRRMGSSDELREISERLYRSLILPVEGLLDREKQLVIVPDGHLNRLPFAILTNAKGVHLIEDFTLSYSPSSNIFVRTTQTAVGRRTTNETLLSVGDPEFDRADNMSLEALPSAAAEARNIATHYPYATTLLGVEATKAKFVERLPTANIVHYAGHYVVNDSSPANSRLVLAAGNDSPDLRLDELVKLRIDRSMLVVLSACETTSENIIPGEGPTGIAQKFIAIGAPLVIAGNWKIDSESTSTLMQAFHANRRSGRMRSAEALRQAQLAAMRDQNGNPRPPFYWAAFAAIGGYTEY